jgi:hypothetical protein
MKIYLILFLISFCSGAYAQTGSEIYLFDIKIRKGKIRLSNPQNVTNHPGYDNQPSFHTDEPIMYFTSFNEEGRADLKSYNYKSRQTKNITQTSEREYSPTLTPDKKYLSCIIQRDNGTQDLGKYPVSGGEPVVLIDNLMIGYHVWGDNSHVALFVLGKENSPNTLHYLRLPTKKDTVLAENIGRSFHKVPNETAFSYIHKISEGNWEIKKVNTSTLKSETIASTLPGREDITWTPSGIILSSDGTKLYQLRDKVWEVVVLKESIPALKGITRLAVNTKGDKLAVVVSE